MALSSVPVSHPSMLLLPCQKMQPQQLRARIAIPAVIHL
jgi:hypothetical protein